MLSIIVALNENYVIGCNNKLIWHISRDLKRFKKITYGKTIIMGRKTFESLPGILPNRKHIVITRDHNYSIKDENALVVHNIKDVLKYVHSEEDAFVIGGGEIYTQLLPYCTKLYLTKVISKKKGDTYFPQFNMEDYTVIECEKHNEDNIEYSFITLEKHKIF
ncbi:dihydrofolate reductase [Clostridium sp. BJN0013]|uniref:dihydrofolate reductase n=1 Tax=Clostridium sp. BJN0013 TaxID=3236840 RepID=UPI0034C5C1E6